MYNGYNTHLASSYVMGVNIRLLTSVGTVLTGQSIHNEYWKWLASPLIMGIIKWLASPCGMVISLLRLWTHNWPFFDFPHDLSMTPCDMIQTSGTAHTLFWHPEKLWHVPRPVMCSVTLPKDGPRNSDQPQCHTLLYIVSHSLTLEWHVPGTCSCLKFYLSYKLFPSLNSCFTILSSYFSLFLWLFVCNQSTTLSFYLALFYYKTPCT